MEGLNKNTPYLIFPLQLLAGVQRPSRVRYIQSNRKKK